MTTPAKSRKAKPALMTDDPKPEAAETPAPKARKPRASAKPRTSTDVATIQSALLQLNFWPEEVRGVPNAALRGALFSISKERSTAKKRQRLATVDGYRLTFKGERFNQHDLDLWEMLLHISRQQQYGSRIEVVARDLLKALGRATGGADYEELKEDMARLQAGYMEINFTATNTTFTGQLIDKFARDETTQRYVIIIDPAMRKMYDAGYTHIDWQQRMQLKGNSLAKWLHGFYATHAAPLKYKVATIHELCGSTTGRLADFRTALRSALDRLKDVGAITDWEIDKTTDLVTVKRKGSLSQQKHLAKQAGIKSARAFADSTSGSFDGFSD